MEVVHEAGKQVDTCKTHSFREALLNERGFTEEGEASRVFDENEILPEDRWYLDPEEGVKIDYNNEDAIPVIPVSDEELQDWCDPWKLTLVVNVLDKKLSFRVLESKINRDWARFGKVKIIDLPRGFYAVQFESDDDYKHVLFEGPWRVADHYLLVQRWKPNFINRAKTEKKVAMWVRIPELALELYNQKFLSRLGGLWVIS